MYEGDDMFSAAQRQPQETIEQRRKQIDDYASSMVRQLSVVLREQFLDVSQSAFWLKFIFFIRSMEMLQN